MSDDRQVRFYQISLTGGQMLAAFFVSILLLGGAFALGFSAARSAGSGAAPVEGPPLSTTAEPAPAGEPAAETAAEAPAEPIASLGEIAVDAEEPAAETAAPAPDRAASAVPAPREEPVPASPSSAAGKGTDAAAKGESKPAAKGDPSGDARKAAAPASAAPAKGATPAPKPASSAAKPGDAASNGWTVQVAALGAKDKAEALRKKLAQRYSTTVVVVPMKVGGKNLFAVRVGKYREKADAEKMASRLRGAEKDLKETRVVPR